MEILGKKVVVVNKRLNLKEEAYVAAFDIQKGITLKRLADDTELFCYNAIKNPCVREALQVAAAEIEEIGVLNTDNIPISWDSKTGRANTSTFGTRITCFTK